MISLLILRVFILLLLNTNTAYQNPHPDLTQVNNIEIHFFKGRRPYVYKSSKKIDILYLKDLILKSKNNPNLETDTTGEIIYLKNKLPVFNAFFYTTGSGSKYNRTGVVMFSNGNVKTRSLFNYGSGMLIDEEFYQLNRHTSN